MIDFNIGRGQARPATHDQSVAQRTFNKIAVADGERTGDRSAPSDAQSGVQLRNFLVVASNYLLLTIFRIEKVEIAKFSPSLFLVQASFEPPFKLLSLSAFKPTFIQSWLEVPSIPSSPSTR
jgi:hypothetical protein